MNKVLRAFYGIGFDEMGKHEIKTEDKSIFTDNQKEVKNG